MSQHLIQRESTVYLGLGRGNRAPTWVTRFKVYHLHGMGGDFNEPTLDKFVKGMGELTQP